MRRELLEAFGAGRPIIPVLLHGITPPHRSQLPPELAGLADKQAVIISDADFRDDVGRLIETLERFGAEPATLEAFGDIPASARAEARGAWDVADDPIHARERLTAALAARGIHELGQQGDDLLLAGGSRWKTRLFGGLNGPASRLPVTGRLRIRDRGATVAIEVLLAEDWGAVRPRGGEGFPKIGCSSAADER